jgi:hypothetical protein
MSKSNLFSFFSVAALSLGLAISAGATTVTIGATAPATAVTSVFGPVLTATTPGSWSGTAGTGTANVAVVNSYLDPLAGPGYFAYAQAGNTITANFSAGITSLDLLWGSPDTYNTLTFYTGLNGTGTSESFVPGSGALAALPATQVGGTLVLFTSTTGPWQSVKFTSSQNSFEFANILVVPAPEPASIALLAGGLLAIGAGAIRRRKS